MWAAGAAIRTGHRSLDCFVSDRVSVLARSEQLDVNGPIEYELVLDDPVRVMRAQAPAAARAGSLPPASPAFGRRASASSRAR